LWKGRSETRPYTPSDRARTGSLFAQHRPEKQPVASITLRQQALPAPLSGVRIWHGCGANVDSMPQMGNRAGRLRMISDWAAGQNGKAADLSPRGIIAGDLRGAQL
jgi:hypothetical protein